jgi:hypothetical protein
VWSNTYTLEMAEELVRLEVPLELARSAIVDACAKLRQRPHGVKYFRPVVLAAFNATAQRALDQASSAPGTLQRTGTNPAARVAYNPGNSEHAQRKEYDADLRDAARAWLADSANESAAETIKADAMTANADVPSEGLRAIAVEMDVNKAAAKAWGFPDFGQWCEERKAEDASLEGHKRDVSTA